MNRLTSNRHPVRCVVPGLFLILSAVGVPGWGQALLLDSSNSRDPLFISNDKGETWLSVGSGLPDSAEVSFIERDGAQMLVATDNAGVFMKRADTAAWTDIGDSLPSRKVNAFHVKDGVVHVAPYRQGILQSIDQGKTWQSLNFNLSDLAVQAIATADSLFFGTDTGVFAFDPLQRSWTRRLADVQVVSLEWLDKELVAGTSRGTAISGDQGKTWRWSQDRNAVHYSRVVGGLIVELKLNGDVLISPDRGISWRRAKYGPRRGSYVYEIVNVEGSLVMSNNYGIHRSNDSGQSWRHVYKTESMAFFALHSDGQTLYGGTRAWDEFRKRR